MYKEADARVNVLEAGHRLVEKKLIARTWGNISARTEGNSFIITPSGKSYDTIGPEDLCKVDLETLEYEGHFKPSVEKTLHAAAYRLRPECNFVVHTHQFYASAICAEEKDTDFAPCAKYGLSGSQKLADNVAEAIRNNPDCKMFLMAKHGAVCLGESYEEAFALAGELEEKCRELFEREKKKAKRPNAPWLDDYAQMFSCFNKPIKDEDMSAMELVRAKNTAAAQYVTKAGPVPFFRHILEHSVYSMKYSKLKDKK